MVVKLYFTDGTNLVHSFSDEELDNLKLNNKLLDYFMEKMSPEFMIDSFEISKNKKEDFEKFDYRDYFNYSGSFIGLEIMDRIVDRIEFFEEFSYEYNLDSLENSSYFRYVKFNYPYEHYDLRQISGLGK